ncbi:L-threonylcarbamoyladenylate synthase [Bdellovibrionales bacterium]|nr:L-threonylcarbamoyladenylate synthase [Bdellovibrionales bacterium]
MLEAALEQLRLGKVIAYSTETVWGLGVDATNEEAIRQLFALKGREFSSAVSILVKSIEMATEWAEVSSKVEKFLTVIWPGPVTVVLPKKKNVSDLLTGGSEYIGLRCSSHRPISDLVWGFSKPITTTSANFTGEPSPTRKIELGWLPETVFRYGDDSLEAGSRRGSTVVKIDSHDSYLLLREGDFPVELVERILRSFGIEPC